MVPAHLKPQPCKTKLTVDKVDADEQDTLTNACSSDSIMSYMKKGTIVILLLINWYNCLAFYTDFPTSRIYFIIKTVLLSFSD